MKLNFYLRFHSNFGESLSITGNIPELGENDPSSAIPLRYLNPEFWCTTIELDPKQTTKFQYSYILHYADGYQVMDDGNDRIIDISKLGIDELDTVDTWNFMGHHENAAFTAPFQEILLKDQETRVKPKTVKSFTHIFKIKAPLLKKNEVVCLVGNSIALNEWDVQNPLLLHKDGNWWNIKLNMPPETFPVQYKYGIYNLKEKKTQFLEPGTNRHLHGNRSQKKVTVVHDGFARFSNTNWRGAGVSIPVFSLKSKNSFGVGEFTDIKLLADWAETVGLKLIQILPVNDTTATHSFADSYPYAAISAFALHPIYINLEEVAGKKHASIVKQLKKKQKQLNELPQLDYEQVMKFKLSTLKEIFVEDNFNFLDDADFRQFFVANSHWLIPYAAFCYLRDKNGTANFTKWKIYANYDKEGIAKYVSAKAKHFDSIALQYFIQYHLHLQLKDATAYAHKKGVIVKGDIPIGVYRYSCDAWMHPELFNMHLQAGAPPDDFAIKGQNWGFPTYNWQKMQENKFAWWRQRFEQMSSYFDAFRIDHILGFFRIWSIPIEQVQGIMGRFDPAIPVHIVEFSQRSIWFDHDRYTKPYITNEILAAWFGDKAEQVKANYLNEKGINNFELKDEFNTQQKIELAFAASGNEHETLKNGLLDLVANVILFDVANHKGEQFHFRFGIENTESFKALDWHTQQQLKDLYIDYFFHRQDNFWMREAMKKLPALKASTNMLICGEDLGMVPHSVPDVMKQLGILSLELQRMPKQLHREFFHPNDAPYLSVVTPSTHDMSTVRGWWNEDRSKTQRFFNHELGQMGEAPLICEPWINKAIIIQHLYSPAMWSIFQLQDILGMSENLRRSDPDEERINIPADPKHYWRYRMHINLEQLIKEKEFNKDFSDYLQASGR